MTREQGYNYGLLNGSKICLESKDTIMTREQGYNYGLLNGSNICLYCIFI